MIFNNNILTPSDSHKHLGLILDNKLNFKNHLSEKISKANKGLGVIKRLYKFLPRASLVNIYRAFVRPHLDYGDIIYDNSSNATFSQMIESVQYNAALTITGVCKIMCHPCLPCPHAPVSSVPPVLSCVIRALVPYPCSRATRAIHFFQ